MMNLLAADQCLVIHTCSSIQQTLAPDGLPVASHSMCVSDVVCGLTCVVLSFPLHHRGNCNATLTVDHRAQQRQTGATDTCVCVCVCVSVCADGSGDMSQWTEDCTQQVLLVTQTLID